VVDTVGDIETLEAAWETLGMGGDIISLTTHHDRSLAPPLREFVVNESSLRGSRYATRDQVVRAARLLADGRIDPVSTGRIRLDEVPSYHRALRNGETHGMTILEP
jgi:D-arabinose 1-dehydrogenase-like Zn-dependent alcohol dehydrogenase